MAPVLQRRPLQNKAMHTDESSLTADPHNFRDLDDDMVEWLIAESEESDRRREGGFRAILDEERPWIKTSS